MERLKQLREAKGLYQKDVAAFLGVDRTTYVKYERGDSEPNHDTLSKLASFFDVSVDYLLGRTDVPKEAQTLDEQLKGVDFALYGETHDLTEEEKQDILEFVQYIKSKRKNKES